MSKILKHIADYNLENKDLNILSSNDLTKMAIDNPWKNHEGLSIKANFESIKKEAPIFTDVISKLVVEIRFIKVFNTKLQRAYWSCIYFFGDDANGNPKYMIGGEPEIDTPTSKELKENGWEEYPEELHKFWKIHGIFETNLTVFNPQNDFNLLAFASLFTEQQSGNLSHYSRLNEIAGDYEDYQHDYLKKGILFGEYMLIVKSQKGLPQFIEMEYEYPKKKYKSFWKQFTKNIKLQSFGLGLEMGISSEVILHFLQKQCNKKGTVLKLSGSNLKQIPKEISQLKKLKKIILRYNELTEIPNFLAEIPKLKTIDLTGNKFTEFPKNLYQCKNLEHIILSKNKITATPKELPHFSVNIEGISNNEK